MPTTVHGVESILYIGPNSGSAFVYEETRSINVSAETDFADDGAQGDTWKTSLPGRSTFSMEIETNYDAATGGGRLLKNVIARDLMKFYFYPSRLTATIYVYGTGYLGGGGFNTSMDDSITQTYTLEPSGQPAYVHP